VAHRKNGLEFAVRKVGTVTEALHEFEPGAKVGVRGPYGNSFPLEDYKERNIYIIGGGIGMAPLRPVIHTILDNRSDYGQLVILNGARTPQDLVYAADFDSWAEADNSSVELTVDRGDETWQGRVALIPAVVAELGWSPQNAVVIICGPPIMIRFTMVELEKLGFVGEQIVTTLEAKMKCGLGKCARCNVGDKYVCKDGPVFTFAEITQFMEQY
jgi:NAD(P)H-flavin reductase